MSAVQRLARLVILDGQVWVPGDVPPPEVAARIRNPQCWEPLEGTPTTEPEADAAAPAPDPGVEPVVDQQPAAEVVIAEDVEPEPEQLRHEVDPVPEPAKPVADEHPPAPLPEPPRSGKGSGEPAWRKYATDHGMAVPEGTSRDDIISACREAGLIK